MSSSAVRTVYGAGTSYRPKLTAAANTTELVPLFRLAVGIRTRERLRFSVDEIYPALTTRFSYRTILSQTALPTLE